MSFYIEPVVKATKKSRKKRAAKIDAPKRAVDIVGSLPRQPFQDAPVDVSILSYPTLTDEEIAVLDVESHQGPTEKSKIIPEPETYYWAMRFGQLEIVLTDKFPAYFYLHGMENINKTENIELLGKIERIKI